MANPFDPTDRGLEHYQRLKSDLEQRSTDILIHLPLFVRIVLKDAGSNWYEEFNKHDLLNPFFVHSDFPTRQRLDHRSSAARNIRATHTHVKSLDANTFLASEIIELDGTNYTVDAFLDSIAYHRGIHNVPDKPELSRLYSDFALRRSHLAFEIVVEIAHVFVESFHDVYSKFMGNNDAISPENYRQPQIVDQGQIIRNGSGGIAAYFSNSYMQLPMRGQYKKGIRICLELQIESGSEGFLFDCGNRKSEHTAVCCRIVHGYMLTQTWSQNPRQRKTIRLPIADEFTKTRFWLEVALYHSGTFVVSINRWMKDIKRIGGRFNIHDGKLILGTDADGRNGAAFYSDCVQVETIDDRRRTSAVFRAAISRRLPPFNPMTLPEDLVERPISV